MAVTKNIEKMDKNVSKQPIFMGKMVMNTIGIY
jgi:hypothetical protein